MSEHDVRFVQWEDIESVLDRLCDQHSEELNRSGWSYDQFRLKLMAFMLKGEVRALWFDGEPQVIFAIAHEDGIGATTWLLCSKEFFDRGIYALKWCRQYLKDAVARHGPLLSLSNSGHPDAERWMKIFGYELIDVQENGVKVFLLR